MRIKLVKGLGRGPTELAAFHEALRGAGIDILNLDKLSSVIPVRAEIEVVDKLNLPHKKHGYLMDLVRSYHTVSKSGDVACAGIGWTQYPDGSGYFVEHHGNSEKEVRYLLKRTLSHMITKDEKNLKRFKLNLEDLEVKLYTISGECYDKDEPVCAFVGALYKLKEPYNREKF
ncbi:hypothetical protein HYX17_01750 [Candidatus Woesearchaeota archaeon]|nr:hypothetical protein [Candidatus Woesearchaeota archaeon]